MITSGSGKKRPDRLFRQDSFWRNRAPEKVGFALAVRTKSARRNKNKGLAARLELSPDTRLAQATYSATCKATGDGKTKKARTAQLKLRPFKTPYFSPASTFSNSSSVRAATSKRHSFGFLSGRSPWKTGARILIPPLSPS